MEGVWNGQSSQILLSLHLLQTSPGLTSAIFVAVSSMSISKDLVMGFCKCHASLRKVALPIWDSSGVYAMVLSPFCCLILNRPVLFSNYSRLLGVLVVLTDWED